MFVQVPDTPVQSPQASPPSLGSNSWDFNLSRKPQEGSQSKRVVRYDIYWHIPKKWRKEQEEKGCVCAFNITTPHPLPFSRVPMIHISCSSSFEGTSSKGVGRIGHEMVSFPHSRLVVDCAILHGQLIQKKI